MPVEGSKVSADNKYWRPGILKRVSRKSYDAVTRARGFGFMTPQEREGAARSMDELFNRSPTLPVYRPGQPGPRVTFQERQNAARNRAEQTRKQQCPECGTLRRLTRGNPGEYAACSRCGAV